MNELRRSPKHDSIARFFTMADRIIRSYVCKRMILSFVCVFFVRYFVYRSFLFRFSFVHLEIQVYERRFVRVEISGSIQLRPRSFSSAQLKSITFSFTQLCIYLNSKPSQDGMVDSLYCKKQKSTWIQLSSSICLDMSPHSIF